MNSPHSKLERTRLLGLAVAAGVTAVCGPRLGYAQSDDDAGHPAVETSINALMVALVDHAAHEIWEAASAATLTRSDWQTVEQHAIQLVASGTLIALGGTGRADQAWAMEPAWQNWARELTDGGLAALAAVEHADKDELHAAGELIIDTCFGCHDMFKPDAPTEGLLHVPHYED